ncbi:hypothetical protein BV898_10166 [Hypsibius exemplaris]|uniref:Uncharacterized protein n=1 Tax=Hypsibius exemplaris TaxID=2072580 RepID=A0A1W0WKE2_HYPEX|nr:hypothetical protein BV898_10166 [Hypsibius exemplaris]
MNSILFPMVYSMGDENRQNGLYFKGEINCYHWAQRTRGGAEEAMGILNARREEILACLPSDDSQSISDDLVTELWHLTVARDRIFRQIWKQKVQEGYQEQLLEAYLVLGGYIRLHSLRLIDHIIPSIYAAHRDIKIYLDSKKIQIPALPPLKPEVATVGVQVDIPAAGAPPIGEVLPRRSLSIGDLQSSFFSPPSSSTPIKMPHRSGWHGKATATTHSATRKNPISLTGTRSPTTFFFQQPQFDEETQQQPHSSPPEPSIARSFHHEGRLNFTEILAADLVLVAGSVGTVTSTHFPSCLMDASETSTFMYAPADEPTAYAHQGEKGRMIDRDRARSTSGTGTFKRFPLPGLGRTMFPAVADVSLESGATTDGRLDGLSVSVMQLIIKDPTNGSRSQQWMMTLDEGEFRIPRPKLRLPECPSNPTDNQQTTDYLRRTDPRRRVDSPPLDSPVYNQSRDRRASCETTIVEPSESMSVEQGAAGTHGTEEWNADR